MLDSHAPISTATSHSESSSATAGDEDVEDSFNPHGASVDTSRIIRADYSNPIYTSLASQAQECWRSDDALSKHYHECGLAVVGSKGKSGWEYVEKSRTNVAEGSGKGDVRQSEEKEPGGKAESLQVLEDADAIRKAMKTGGDSGEAGYVNWRSGWADAGAAMTETRKKVTTLARRQRRKLWKRGNAERLLLTISPTSSASHSKQRIRGVGLADGSEIQAELVILALGAWSGGLLDLRGRVEASGQVLAYVPLSSSEAQSLRKMPVLFNLGTGMFAIPPPRSSSNPHLKIARHAYGYRNPTVITDSTTSSSPGASRTVSLPSSHFSPIPPEAEHECRAFLAALVPWLADRAFESSRLCWYADTPEGNFLVDYHPDIDGLFLATGDSGHAFKFLPILGDEVLKAVEGRLEEDLRRCWVWPKETKGFQGTEDGSRGGMRGTILEKEMKRDLRTEQRRNNGSKL